MQPYTIVVKSIFFVPLAPLYTSVVNVTSFLSSLTDIPTY